MDPIWVMIQSIPRIPGDKTRLKKPNISTMKPRYKQSTMNVDRKPRQQPSILIKGLPDRNIKFTTSFIIIFAIGSTFRTIISVYIFFRLHLGMLVHVNNSHSEQ